MTYEVHSHMNTYRDMLHLKYILHTIKKNTKNLSFIYALDISLPVQIISSALYFRSSVTKKEPIIGRSGKLIVDDMCVIMMELNWLSSGVNYAFLEQVIMVHWILLI